MVSTTGLMPLLIFSTGLSILSTMLYVRSYFNWAIRIPTVIVGSTSLGLLLTVAISLVLHQTSDPLVLIAELFGWKGRRQLES